MKKIDVSGFTFTPAAKTISSPTFGTIGLARILLIVNATRGAVLYDPSSASTNGTLSGNTLTLAFDTTTHNASDALAIFYDDGATGASETGNILESLQALNETLVQLQEFFGRMRVTSNGLGQLRVAFDTNSSMNTIGSITSLNSVTTLNNVNADIAIRNQTRLLEQGLRQGITVS